MRELCINVNEKPREKRGLMFKNAVNKVLSDRFQLTHAGGQ